MFDFYEKRKIKQLLYSWPTLILLALVSFFLLNAVLEVYKKEKETRINKNQQLFQLEELEKRQIALEEEILRLSTPRGVEEEIRQKFEVAKEGEGVIVIVDIPKSDGERKVYKRKGIFRQFLDFILLRN